LLQGLFWVRDGVEIGAPKISKDAVGCNKPTAHCTGTPYEVVQCALLIAPYDPHREFRKGAMSFCMLHRKKIHGYCG
jgi:hypothetical protein